MRTIELLCNRLDSVLRCATLQVFVHVAILVKAVTIRGAALRVRPFARWDPFRVHFAVVPNGITLSAAVAGTIFQYRCASSGKTSSRWVE